MVKIKIEAVAKSIMSKAFYFFGTGAQSYRNHDKWNCKLRTLLLKAKMKYPEVNDYGLCLILHLHPDLHSDN